jgi:hypothetical protein
VGRRLLPVALVVAATWADSRELHELGFYLLVAAVPAAAVSALSLFGELVDLPARARGEGRTRLETALASLGLLLLLVAAALRGNGVEADVPPLAVSTLVACLFVFGAQPLTALAATARSPLRHRSAERLRIQDRFRRERVRGTVGSR